MWERGQGNLCRSCGGHRLAKAGMACQVGGARGYAAGEDGIHPDEAGRVWLYPPDTAAVSPCCFIKPAPQSAVSPEFWSDA